MRYYVYNITAPGGIFGAIHRVGVNLLPTETILLCTLRILDEIHYSDVLTRYRKSTRGGDFLQWDIMCNIRPRVQEYISL